MSAVWHNGGNLATSCAASKRITGFVDTPASKDCADLLLNYAREHVGERIRTNEEEAAPAVYGNPRRKFRPLLPPRSSDWRTERRILKDFFEKLWVWQGGKAPPPWVRLAEDGEIGNYYLVEQHRLPESVSALHDPETFDEYETNAWATFLRAPEYTGLKEFQLRQPTPWIIYKDTGDRPAKLARVHYSANSLLYARRLLSENGGTIERWNGLPVVPAVIPTIFTPEVMHWAKMATSGAVDLQNLLDFAVDYELFAPYQATRRDYEKAHVRLLSPDLPSLTAGHEHTTIRYMFAEMHDPADMIDEAAEWISGDAFTHRSGSLMGGPYGLKWQVLVLATLCAFAVEHREAVSELARILLSKLAQSIEILDESKAERGRFAGEPMECEPTADLWDPKAVSRVTTPLTTDAWTVRLINID
ncbi:hypothetical protein FS749_010146 [Ceratobasidium sp. UAMH 11750]|nr:hypothetical protein FS749_010146 [Ceratobasidium sp. UAMH 11750]